MSEFDATAIPEDEIFEVDLNAESKSFNGWKAEKVEAFISTIEFGTSKSSGNPMITWTYRVPSVNNWTIKHYTVTSGEGKWKAQEAIIAADLGKEGEKTTLVKRNCIGRRVMIQIKLEEYNGKMQGKVDKVLPHKDGAVVKDDSLPF